MSIPFTWVYLFHDEEMTGLYKIGKSDDPPRRLAQLKAPQGGTILAAPQEYTFLDAWLCPIDTEGLLHKQFEDCRVRGEWFDLDYCIDHELLYCPNCRAGRTYYQRFLHQMRRYTRWESQWTGQEEQWLLTLQNRDGTIATLEAENEVLRIYARQTFELGPLAAGRKLLPEPMGDIAF